MRWSPCGGSAFPAQLVHDRARARPVVVKLFSPLALARVSLGAPLIEAFTNRIQILAGLPGIVRPSILSASSVSLRPRTCRPLVSPLRYSRASPHPRQGAIAGIAVGSISPLGALHSAFQQRQTVRKVQPIQNDVELVAQATQLLA